MAVPEVRELDPSAEDETARPPAPAHAELLEAELTAIKATRAWRLLEPARNAYGTVRRRTARR